MVTTSPRPHAHHVLTLTRARIEIQEQDDGLISLYVCDGLNHLAVDLTIADVQQIQATFDRVAEWTTHG